MILAASIKRSGFWGSDINVLVLPLGSWYFLMILPPTFVSLINWPPAWIVSDSSFVSVIADGEGSSKSIPL